MKKISFLFLILLLFCLTSCHKLVVVNNDSTELFINEVYEAINSEDISYLCIDLRSIEEYETLHIRQFQNYDFAKGDEESLLKWINSISDKDTKFFIITNNIELDFDIFKEYKKVYIYDDLFENLKELASQTFMMDKGPYDCGC